LLEAGVRLLEKFPGHSQIVRSLLDTYVAQVGAQLREKTLDVFALPIPSH
jgi:hypothetical protein